jgi:FdhE protein
VHLLDVTLQESLEPAWDRATATLAPSRDSDAPLLAAATIAIDTDRGRRWVRRLVRAADRGRARDSSVAGAAARLDPLAFLRASLDHDLDRLHGVATDAGADPTALGALTGLAATPLLLALGSRLAGSVPADWAHGYCPLCGAWPVAAELRGLERQRRLRCGRCGHDWRVDWQRCPFCGESRHTRLGALVSETRSDGRRAETCESCRGYIKAVSTIRPWPAAEVALEDLATVDLDAAALERGYTRPDRPGYVLRARLDASPVRDRPGGRPRLLPWRR